MLKNFITCLVFLSTTTLCFGETNILNKLPVSASSLYAKNMYNFVENLFDKKSKKININLEDEIIEKTLIK